MRGALVAGLCALVATCRAPQGPAAPDEVRPLALVEVQRLELEAPPEAFRVRKRPIGCWLDARGRAWVALLGTGVHVFGQEGRHELWLATPWAALARASWVEREGLHEVAFTAAGELIVFLERRPGLVRYRLDLR